MTAKSTGFETRVIHAGNTTDAATGAVMPPIVTSTTFEWEGLGQPREHVYTRASNPTRNALERCVAELESGTRALAYASGQAATAGILDLLDAGSHVIAPLDFYGGTRRLFELVRSRTSGLEFSFVDMSDPARVSAAVRPATKLIWIESPTNPLLKITDIAAVAAIARQHKVLSCVDNTFATPCTQRPLELGIDIVMHSATKYFGGHSDVLGGLVVVKDAELGQQLHLMRSASGGVLGPFDSYLVIRGIKTLALRMERHCANALAVARFLESHPLIARVRYAGLPTHPQHAVARRIFPDGRSGAMLSFDVADCDQVRAVRFLDALRLVLPATTLGDIYSLIVNPARSTHRWLGPERLAELGIQPGTFRMSVGIENVDDIQADLDQALRATSSCPAT